MVTDSLEKKKVKKTILTATAVLGTSVLLFMGFQAASASEQEKGEVQNSDISETGNITPELQEPVGEVPSEQTEGEEVQNSDVSETENITPELQEPGREVPSELAEGKASMEEYEVSEPTRLEGETLEEYRLRNK